MVRSFVVGSWGPFMKFRTLHCVVQMGESPSTLGTRRTGLVARHSNDIARSFVEEDHQSTPIGGGVFPAPRKRPPLGKRCWDEPIQRPRSAKGARSHGSQWPKTGPSGKTWKRPWPRTSFDVRIARYCPEAG